MATDAVTWSVLLAAATIAFLHTALGPDHTLPFVMLSRARRWSVRKTLLVTTACGIGHVASSLVLGLLGLVLGASVGAVEHAEGFRGDLAGWALVVFGSVYGLWGLRRALRARTGLELHEHGGHVHLHRHGIGAHVHPHVSLPTLRLNAHRAEPVGRSATFWTLFLVFVLGPCEPLIPLFLIPASQGRWVLAAWTGIVFAIVTLVTMLALVGVAVVGLARFDGARLERWTHALAGATVAGSGLAVLFAGL
jgi:hypothetical protein